LNYNPQFRRLIMSDSLTIINRILEEHQTIRGHVKLVGDSVSDEEALSSLEKVRADWIPGRPGVLSEKQKRLQRTISALGEGLKNHFAYEEKTLPPLLGELLMRSLMLEHRAIKQAIEETKSVVAKVKLEGLERAQLLSEEARMQEVVDNICQLVEEHAHKEETVLTMVQAALQEEG
jgi:hypothetical protein